MSNSVLAIKLRHALNELDFHSSGKWLVLATVVGVLVGVTAIVFHYACFVVNEWTFRMPNTDNERAASET